MTLQTLKIQTTPTRMLKKSQAAGYCGLSLPKFDQECPVTPVEYGCGEVRFDVHDLDRWIDGLKSGFMSQHHDEIIEKLE